MTLLKWLKETDRNVQPVLPNPECQTTIQNKILVSTINDNVSTELKASKNEAAMHQCHSGENWEICHTK